jgi:PKHD-type hydroxylase
VILSFADVIDSGELAQLHALAASEPFVPGMETAGERLAGIKHNEQLARGSAAIGTATTLLVSALKRHAAFRDACYPKQLHSVLVSRYRPGMAYGPHVDNALMGEQTAWRTDLSLTLFLVEPDDYDGGELSLESGSGEVRVKLPARGMVCYPTSQLHEVREVTRGERLALVGWVQSYVRDACAREALWDLAQARDAEYAQHSKSRVFDLINKTHTNLLRRWAEP